MMSQTDTTATIELMGAFFGQRQVMNQPDDPFGNHCIKSEDVEEKETGRKTGAFIWTARDKNEPCNLSHCILGILSYNDKGFG